MKPKRPHRNFAHPNGAASVYNLKEGTRRMQKAYAMQQTPRARRIWASMQQLRVFPTFLEHITPGIAAICRENIQR